MRSGVLSSVTTQGKHQGLTKAVHSSIFAWELAPVWQHIFPLSSIHTSYHHPMKRKFSLPTNKTIVQRVQWLHWCTSYLNILTNQKLMPGLFFLIFHLRLTPFSQTYFNLKLLSFRLTPILFTGIFSFLTNRVQLVKVNYTLSSPNTTNVRVPQGYLRSPVLFTLYTSDCTTSVPNHYLLKYSDDSILVTLFTQSKDHTLYQGNVDWLVKWCDTNLLIIITVKTEGITFGKTSHLQLSPVKIHNSEINQVPTYKY